MNSENQTEYTVKLVEKYNEINSIGASMCLEALVIGATLASSIYLTSTYSMNNGITLPLLLNLSSFSIMGWQCSKFFIKLIKKTGLEQELAEIIRSYRISSEEYLDDWMDKISVIDRGLFFYIQIEELDEITADKSANSGTCKVKKF